MDHHLIVGDPLLDYNHPPHNMEFPLMTAYKQALRALLSSARETRLQDEADLAPYKSLVIEQGLEPCPDALYWLAKAMSLKQEFYYSDGDTREEWKIEELI